MPDNLKDLTFTRRYHINAVKRNYDIVRSKMIDCGRIHREYDEPYGGEKEWIEAKAASSNENAISLKIPIRIDPDHGNTPGYSSGTYRTTYTETLRDEINIDYPTVLIFDQTPQSLSPQISDLQAHAEKRQLKADTSPFITAAIWYGTTSPEKSDAFVVQLYHAWGQYKRVPQQWTSLSPSGADVRLKYASAAPNTRAFPQGAGLEQYYKWDNVPKEGYLIARITDLNGTHNPVPTDTILPEAWFDRQTQWAIIPIK